MVVRTWRKISAPGRLGQSSKHSPSNVLQQADKGNQGSSGSESTIESHSSRRRTAARQLFHSQSFQQNNGAFGERQESTPGELAINCLLLEFSTYARSKIEKALTTVKRYWGSVVVYDNCKLQMDEIYVVK